jgi:hypothetical protein
MQTERARAFSEDEYPSCSGEENRCPLRAEGPLNPSLGSAQVLNSTIHRAEEAAEKVAVLKGRGFSHAINPSKSTRL